MTQLPHAITLKKPIDHGSQTVTELVFEREPIAEDFFDLPPAGWSNGQYASVISRLTGQPLPVIKRLSLPDFRAALELVQDFLSAGLSTGDEP